MICELGKVAKIGTGQSAPQDSEAFSEYGIPFIRAGSLEGLIRGKTEDEFERISLESAQKYRLKLFPKNTVIFAKSGMSATLGRVYRLERDCYLVSHLAAVEPYENLDPKYLHRWFEANPPSRLINNEAYPSIKTSEIEKLQIPLLPLSEQKRIAAILDKADIIRRKRQQAIQLADEFLRAVFLDMFGDPVANSKGWEVKNLKDLSTKILNGTTPYGGKENYVDKGIIFLRSQNVWKRKILLEDIAYIDEQTHKKMSKSSLKHKDILMTKTGRFNTENSSLGRASMFLGEDDSANINGHVYLIRLNRNVINEFVLYILTTNEYRDYIRSICVGGIDKRQINKEHLEKFPIIQPSLEAQKDFSKCMRIVETMKEKAMRSLKESDDLFNALSQKAFAGKL